MTPRYEFCDPLGVRPRVCVLISQGGVYPLGGVNKSLLDSMTNERYPYSLEIYRMYESELSTSGLSNVVVLQPANACI